MCKQMSRVYVTISQLFSSFYRQNSKCKEREREEIEESWDRTMLFLETLDILASAPLHTQDTEIGLGCPGVTAATELLNIR